MTEAAYAHGKVDFLRLVESARAIEMLHLEHVDAAAAFEKAFADLERAVARRFRVESNLTRTTRLWLPVLLLVAAATGALVHGSRRPRPKGLRAARRINARCTRRSSRTSRPLPI